MITITGFINCWSYSWQSLFRNCPDMQNAGDNWMNNLAKRVALMTPDDFYTAAVTHFTECLQGGATTVVDCLYLVKDGKAFEKIIEAAQDIGIRLILVRGSMDRNPTNHPALEPFVQSKNQILGHSEYLIEKCHDPGSNAMLQIALGPCSLKSGSPELYRETANLARKKGVRLFTLLGEDEDDKTFCERQAGSMCHYMKNLNWTGKDVVVVNCVSFAPQDIKEAKECGVSIVDCPRSNARGSGITKLTEIIEQEIPLGIGTAGAAGNDAICMQDELTWARYSQGMRGLDYLRPELVFDLATKGGATVLGRSDLVANTLYNAPDTITYDLSSDLSFAGAVCNPKGSLFGSGRLKAKQAIVDNKILIDNYEPTFQLRGKKAIIRGIFDRQQKAAKRIEQMLSKN